MKARRQKKILELVTRQIITTQKELAAALRSEGFLATQATISRDIKELGIVKVPYEDNVMRYAVAGDSPVVRRNERLRRVFRNSVVGIDHSENLMVVKTLPGEAQGVASALDQAGWPEIIGTVGGDDTILIVARTKRSVGPLLKRFNQLLRG